jgi:hypothetical protein
VLEVVVDVLRGRDGYAHSYLEAVMNTS